MGWIRKIAATKTWQRNMKWKIKLWNKICYSFYLFFKLINSSIESENSDEENYWFVDFVSSHGQKYMINLIKKEQSAFWSKDISWNCVCTHNNQCDK